MLNLVVVSENGTNEASTPISCSQEIYRSNDIHQLMASELAKPIPEIYCKATQLMGLEIEECDMTAAHA